MLKRFKIVWKDYSPQRFNLSDALFASDSRSKILSFPVDEHPFGANFPNVKSVMLLFELKSISNEFNEKGSFLTLEGNAIDLDGKKHKATLQYNIGSLSGEGEVEVEEPFGVSAETEIFPIKEGSRKEAGDVS